MAPAPGRLHVAQRGAGAVERAVQVDLDHPVPVLVGQARRAPSGGTMSSMRPSIRSATLAIIRSKRVRVGRPGRCRRC